MKFNGLNVRALGHVVTKSVSLPDFGILVCSNRLSAASTTRWVENHIIVSPIDSYSSFVSPLYIARMKGFPVCDSGLERQRLSRMLFSRTPEPCNLLAMMIGDPLPRR